MSNPSKPGQIRRNDPARAHLHDYWVIDGLTGKDLAGFANAATAEAYLRQQQARRPQVIVFATVHPAGCTCDEAPPVTSAGRRRR
jgi:hypothetical protein